MSCIANVRHKRNVHMTCVRELIMNQINSSPAAALKSIES